jgi:ketosteroid isomerase-like protein
MKRVLLVASAFVLVAVVRAQSRTPRISDMKKKDETLKLEHQRNEAIIKGDAAALDRMTADDYTFITLRGELRTKSEIVQGFKSGSFHYDSRTISELNVRVYGNTAIVTGRSNQSGKENGKDYSGDYRFTRVPDFKRWKEVRNILAHRAASGRQFSTGSEDDTTKWLGIAVDTSTTVDRRKWLAARLRNLVIAADAFTVSHPV